MSELTKAQWALLEPLLPVKKRVAGKAGRPRIDNKKILTGILWILRTGAPWKDMPRHYGSYQTCHRRYQEWLEQGVIDEILQALVADLERNGKLDISESFIDGTFSSAKKGVLELVRLSCVFQSKVATDSRRKLPPIPREGCHPFQSKAATLNPGI